MTDQFTSLTFDELRNLAVKYNHLKLRFIAYKVYTGYTEWPDYPVEKNIIRRDDYNVEELDTLYKRDFRFLKGYCDGKPFRIKNKDQLKEIAEKHMSVTVYIPFDLGFFLKYFFRYNKNDLSMKYNFIRSIRLEYSKCSIISDDYHVSGPQILTTGEHFKEWYARASVKLDKTHGILLRHFFYIKNNNNDSKCESFLNKLNCTAYHDDHRLLNINYKVWVEENQDLLELKKWAVLFGIKLSDFRTFFFHDNEDQTRELDALLKSYTLLKDINISKVALLLWYAKVFKHPKKGAKLMEEVCKI